MYKLIAIDMDGTLLNSQGKLSDANKESIRLAKEKGIKVVITSGRALSALDRFLEETDLKDLDDYVIANNGGTVHKGHTGECIFFIGIKGSDALKIYEESKKIGFKIHIYGKEVCFITEESKYSDFEINHIGTKVEKVDFNNYIKEDDDLVKILLFAEEDEIDSKIEMLSQDIKEKYHLVKSLPNLVEILPKNSNKGNGIEALGKILKINSEEIIAIGDQANDIEMIEYAGLGIAMGNAIDEIKEIASYITDTNDNDGVAKAIKKFI